MKEDIPGTEILHKNTKRVKLDRNEIVSGELSNRKKIFYDVRSYKNICKMKGARERGVTSAND